MRTLTLRRKAADDYRFLGLDYCDVDTSDFADYIAVKIYDISVFINNSEEDKTIPWSYYSEISEGLKEGIDVLTGTTVTIDDSTKVAPETALVVEFQR